MSNIKYDNNNTAKKIRNKYPGRIPVLIKDTCKLELSKRKYIVPGDITVSQFLHFLRKYIKIEKEEALFIFINDKIPMMSSLMSDTNYTSEDGFMYIDLRVESTFG